MLIIPAIDIREGRCVRLIQGDFNAERVYDTDPLEVAKAFADAGARRIHVVDLDGAKEGEPKNWRIIERLGSDATVPIEFGGGVRSLRTAHRLLAVGIDRVVVGTKLIQDQNLSKRFFDEIGERAVAGIDCRNGMVATAGWLDQSQVSGVELAKRVEQQGAERIILTDISKDGMLSGPNVDLLQSVRGKVKIPVVHSGGISSLEDLQKLADSALPPEGVIIGRALYEGTLNLEEACKQFQ